MGDKSLWILFSLIIGIVVVFIVEIIILATSNVSDIDSRLQKVKGTSIYTIWYNKETKVMYVSYNVPVTVKDSTPLLYEKEAENGARRS